MRRVSSTLVAIVLALLSLGIVMLASTSSVRGAASFDDPDHFLKRQVAWLAVALVIGLGLSRFDYHWWQRLALPVGIGAGVLLLLVFVPGIGLKVGGSHRWLRVGPMSLQPSELAKFAVIIGLSSWMTRIGRRAVQFREGLLYPALGLGVILGLLIIEPDFGTTLLTGVVGMLLLYAGGTRLSYLMVTAALGASGFVLAVLRDPLRLGRVMAFLMPERFPATAYHLQQSKVAFIRGGWFGVGLGNSIQKQFYLPEAHTDFILAIIGEELGFLATALVVLLFFGLVVCGMVISLKAPEPFGRLLGFGMTMMPGIQMAINVGVVTGCLPTKGLPLPFISYGGSSLVMSVACVSVLLNIARHCTELQADEHTRSIKDRGHRL